MDLSLEDVIAERQVITCRSILARGVFLVPKLLTRNLKQRNSRGRRDRRRPAAPRDGVRKVSSRLQPFYPFHKITDANQLGA